MSHSNDSTTSIQPPQEIKTGGGSSIGGNVSPGGDFIGRDQHNNNNNINWPLVVLIIAIVALFSILILAILKTILTSPAPTPTLSSIVTATSMPISTPVSLSPTSTSPQYPTPTTTSTPEALPPIIDGMIFVPAGTFLMGSDPGENPDGNEIPQHLVYLDAFYIGKTEVTNNMYRKCVEESVCEPPEDTGSYTRAFYYNDTDFGNFPIVNVTWEQANTYCQWIGGSLPTEAQWEKAARGTDKRIYPWGNQIVTCDYANYDGCVTDTVQVGSFPLGQSPYGVLDMAGNVEEWTREPYDGNYYSSSPMNNPICTAKSDFYVVRGGAFGYIKADIRTARRSNFKFNQSSPFLGFRCVITP